MRKTLYTIDLVDTLTEATKKGLGIRIATKQELYHAHPKCNLCRYFIEDDTDNVDGVAQMVYTCAKITEQVGYDHYCADWMPLSGAQP